MGSGRYAVEGVGTGVRRGDQLRFTLKGSTTLELRLEVVELRTKIIPQDGWAAVLSGQDFDSLDIHRWSIVCDGCGGKMDFEFAARSGAPQAVLHVAASERIQELGWVTEQAQHLCPGCGKTDT